MVKLKLKITIGRLKAMYDPSSLELKKGLEKVLEVKPLVNGKEIMSVLQLKSGWPLIREWQKKLMAACPSLCDSRGMPWLGSKPTQSV
ncbi:hypothetical protein Pint_07650 [Pistacia integerrima]|uniref:Uncharacterized protein n=1 Tax=Pistacia integerrima TaxID=434235 RepID=A0ACC0XRA2_9ROSI|nr:hypothetical protein Pint_07650 [Pistacia integerrima]